MKITGIIAEYNPFHNGHQYQIRRIREQYGSDYIIAAISGDFVQRGTPAIVDKYTRAEMALRGGADLVLELPAVYATASAEGFARGGIQTLAATGLVDSVSFGMEQAEEDTLSRLCDLLAREPDWYRRKLKEGLKAGLSYPAARSRALPEYAAFLSSPNNILALEYAKAIAAYAPGMKLLPIRRQGSGYHQKKLEQEYSSASAIRSTLQSQTLDFPRADKNVCSDLEALFSGNTPLAKALPESSRALLLQYQKNASFLYEGDLSLPLHCCLLGETRKSLLAVSDMSPALASRILALREEFTSFSGFCEALKTRDLTYTRISRTLLHLLLHITGELVQEAASPPYLRVLGFRRPAAHLLGRMQKECRIPVIISIPEVLPRRTDQTLGADACPGEAMLSAGAQAILKTDLYAGSLYRALLTARTGKAYPGEFRRRMLVVEE